MSAARAALQANSQKTADVLTQAGRWTKEAGEYVVLAYNRLEFAQKHLTAQASKIDLTNDEGIHDYNILAEELFRVNALLGDLRVVLG